jgi:hypothetical protein
MALLAQRGRQGHRERRGQQAHPGQPGRKAPLDLPAPAWEPLARRVLPALPAPQDRPGHLDSAQQVQLDQPGQVVPQVLLAWVLLEPQAPQGRLDPADHLDLAALEQRVLRGQLEPLGQAVQVGLRGRLAPQARRGQQVQAVAAEASALPDPPAQLDHRGRQVLRVPLVLRDQQDHPAQLELRGQRDRPDLRGRVAQRVSRDRQGQQVRQARADLRGHRDQLGRQEQRDQPDLVLDRQVELHSEITSDSNNERIYNQSTKR